MVSYDVIKNAENDVLGALRRAGGELSLSELTDATHLPCVVVKKVVDQLSEKRLVHVSKHPGTGLTLVHLCKRTLWQRVGPWLFSTSKAGQS